MIQTKVIVSVHTIQGKHVVRIKGVSDFMVIINRSDDATIKFELYAKRFLCPDVIINTD